MSEAEREPGKERSGNLREGTGESSPGHIFPRPNWSQNFRVESQLLPCLESPLHHPSQAVTHHMLAYPQCWGAHYFSGNRCHLWTVLTVRTFRFLSPHQPPQRFLGHQTKANFAKRSRPPEALVLSLPPERTPGSTAHQRR